MQIFWIEKRVFLLRFGLLRCGISLNEFSSLIFMQNRTSFFKEVTIPKLTLVYQYHNSTDFRSLNLFILLCTMHFDFMATKYENYMALFWRGGGGRGTKDFHYFLRGAAVINCDLLQFPSQGCLVYQNYYY